MAADRTIRRVERALLVVGLACLGYYGYRTVDANQFQQAQSAAFEAKLAAGSAAPVTPRAPDAREAPDAAEAPDAHVAPDGAAVALLEIPRLDLSAPVMSGDDPATLEVAIGHLPDTPLPWDRGNSAMAAHRDGLFRPLRHVRAGDEVRLRTAEGELTYRVRETKIVEPTDLSVLAPTDTHTLTLITCYPFNFIGNAPKRFIVHADRVYRVD